MAEIERRRRQIAAQAVPGPAPAAGASPALAAAPNQQAGYGPVPAAARGWEPDVAKRKKAKGSAKHGHRDEVSEDARGEPGQDADAYAAAQGHADAMAAEDARKNFAERGAEEGPSHLMPAGHAEPEDFGRPYMSDGRAAPSPQHEAARTTLSRHRTGAEFRSRSRWSRHRPSRETRAR